MATLEVLKGRGGDGVSTRRVGKRGGQFECLRPLLGQQPGDAAKSVEGWVLFVTGLPCETVEGDLVDLFMQFGTIRNIRMTTDQREGKCLGHAMIEYELAEECEKAIQALDGRQFLGSGAIHVSAAFLVDEQDAAKAGDEGEEKKRTRDD